MHSAAEHVGQLLLSDPSIAIPVDFAEARGRLLRQATALLPVLPTQLHQHKILLPAQVAVAVGIVDREALRMYPALGQRGKEVQDQVGG